ncbi:MAG TPA: HipA N-terminal domain-containing protein [Kiritimatiellia bacterium]|nr:HipA N-terminal domain-containing protein [Kiritimatiellia bacterium]
MRKAEIRMFGNVTGYLTETDEGYTFVYTPEYAVNPKNLPISRLLPLRIEPYCDKRLFPFFDGLIPEGWLLAIAEKTWKLDPRDRMGLLLATCGDCIGAVSVAPVEEAG